MGFIWQRVKRDPPQFTAANYKSKHVSAKEKKSPAIISTRNAAFLYNGFIYSFVSRRGGVKGGTSGKLSAPDHIYHLFSIIPQQDKLVFIHNCVLYQLYRQIMTQQSYTHFNDQTTVCNKVPAEFIQNPITCCQTMRQRLHLSNPNPKKLFFFI